MAKEVITMMRSHTLTDEQMKKLFAATYSQRQHGVVAGAYTTNRLKRMIEGSGGLNDWPQHTDDPYVNYVIGCISQDDDLPDYAELAEIYEQEVEEFKKHFA